MTIDSVMLVIITVVALAAFAFAVWFLFFRKKIDMHLVIDNDGCGACASPRPTNNDAPAQENQQLTFTDLENFQRNERSKMRTFIREVNNDKPAEPVLRQDAIKLLTYIFEDEPNRVQPWN